MSKNDEKLHHFNVGVALVGSPAPLIDLLIRDTELNQWATEHIVNEGPKHTRVLNALLLKRIYTLLQAIEKSTGTVFTEQRGYALANGKPVNGDRVPVNIPIHLDAGMDSGKVVEAISKAPELELFTYAMGLQLIEWAIGVYAKRGALIDETLIGDGS